MLLAALVPLEIVVLLAAIPTVDVVGVTAPRAKLAVLILSNSILSVALIEPALVEDATGKFTVVEVSAALPLSLLIVAVTLAAFDENDILLTLLIFNPSNLTLSAALISPATD